MEALPDDLRREIEGLEGLRARDVRKKYAELLSDIPNCQSNGILKAVVAYRLQERHYGVSLSEAARAWLHGAEGTVGQSTAPEANVTNAQLVREWNGVRHVVSIRRDGQYEYNGRIYKSLSAVAREITGTRWNGRIFFKVRG